MAELLQQRGYETVAFSNNTWVSGVTNLTQGFDRYVRPGALHFGRGNSIHEFLDRVLYPAGWVGQWLGTLTAQDVGAKFTNQLVARWLDSRGRRQPFFLFVNYCEPHDPYRPHRPHRELFIKPGDLDASYRTELRDTAEYSILKRDCFTPEQLKLSSDCYDGDTRLMDDYTGELLEVLAEHVPLDDTLIIITSDHGENVGDHHLLGHAHCVYDTLAHVPLLMRYPRRLQPGRTAELVQTTDLLPTVMDAAHGNPVATPSTFGRSLLSPPNGSDAPSEVANLDPASSSANELTGRPVVVERMAPTFVALNQAQGLDTRFDRVPHEGPLRAIRQGPWKYIVAADGREELYHVINDPGETDNAIDQHGPIANRLAERLGQWLKASRPYEHTIQTGGEKRPMDDEALRRLRALGYVE